MGEEEEDERLGFKR